jgi:hypothetical protein
MEDLEAMRIEIPKWLFGNSPTIEEKDAGTHICPQCRGKSIQEESPEGFKVCGVCKGYGTVECIDESYHEDRYSYFFFFPIHREWKDVVGVVAKDRERDEGKEKDFEKVAKYSNTKWLGYTMPLIHMVQNDINFGKGF